MQHMTIFNSKFSSITLFVSSFLCAVDSSYPIATRLGFAIYFSSLWPNSLLYRYRCHFCFPSLVTFLFMTCFLDTFLSQVFLLQYSTNTWPGGTQRHRTNGKQDLFIKDTDSKDFPFQCLWIYWSSRTFQQLPESLNSHTCRLR